jgi:adenylyltransferase/sulfurtransferase
MLDSDERERYARHIVLRDVGGPGQQKIKAARVLCVGAGGLGSAIIQYFAAAGVGTIGIVDDDVVSLSNLQRQVIHGTPDIGRPKVVSAADAVRRLNPHVAAEPHQVRLDAANAADLVRSYDIVVDGLDNFPARIVLADTCAALRRPLVTAAVLEFYGSLTTLMPYVAGPDGELNPSFRCMTRMPADGAATTCLQVGILGSVAGVLGTLAATEVLKLITGVGEPLLRRLLMVDLRDMSFDVVDYRRDPKALVPVPP